MTVSAGKIADALRISIKEAEQLRLRNQQLLDAAHEPIAIVGMACRFPGGASSPADLWELISQERDAITEFPSDRGWDLESLYDPDPETPLTSYTRHGGFLPDAGDFDSDFFGISPREALAIDPQQRLLLEVSWAALEDAGVDPLTLRATQAGIFAGAMYQDYGTATEIAPGMSTSAVSGRVAYAFGLEGPAMTVDTACSSSLVAMHLAVQALRGGECSLALAGGVTVFATPWVLTYFSRQRGLSPDGRCKAFAEAADGAGFAEGVGVLALERLSGAEAKGHNVLAVIRGSAVNQDGASNGLTAPNGPSQERVIRQALANARLEPKDIEVVEAHGTGTTLGDPIEAGALLATYGQERDEPLKLGSVKSNIGHTQAAAGVAGVIKTVLAMREGILPKTLHVDQPSSKVDWEAGEIELLTEPAEWKPNGHPRRAGVSSFGASGTNAHLILEEAPGPREPDEPEEASGLPGPLPFALSAKSPEALRDSAQRLAAHLQDNPELNLTDLSYSLATSRPSFEQRGVVVAGDREELLEGLTALAADGMAPGLVTGRADGDGRPAFLFPGQGSQWPGMALELAESSPRFAAELDSCEEALEPLVDWSLREVLREAEGAWLDRLDVVQPALFAVMVSLARLWQACGVEPSVVIGHSQGEIAAAHVAGGLSLEDAARVIALRGRAMARIAGEGAMASVSLSLADLDPIVSPFGDRISVAAQNGPAFQVLSGDPEVIAELLAACEEEGVRAQRIAVDYAAHSAQIEALREELLDAFSPISPRSGQIPMRSTLTGEPIDTAELGPLYWYRNLRETVRLEPVIRSLLEQGQRTLIEIGPHPVLGFAVQETIDATPESSGVSVLGTLRRDEGGPCRFALALASAHAAGAKLDWGTYFEGTAARAVPLPTYPFQRKRYWIEAATSSGDLSAAGLADAGHPLLGAAIEDPKTGGLTLTGRISLQSHPWLADHAAAGVVLLPGTAFVELALSAARRVGLGILEELTLQAPLLLGEAGAVQLQISLSGPEEEGKQRLWIHSRPETAEESGEWTCHAEGVLSEEAQDPPEPLGTWPPQGAEPIDVDSAYQRLAEAGFDYGPAFQGLTAAWRDGEEVYAEVSLAEEQAPEAERFGVHPALLDAALHGGLDLRMAAGEHNGPLLPFAWSEVRVGSPGAAALRVRLGMRGDTFSLDAFDPAGEVVLSVGAVSGREADPESLAAASSEAPFYLLEWRAFSAAAETADALPAKLLRAEELPFEPSGDPATDARAAATAALAALQEWLAGEGPDSERLVLLTTSALATAEGEDPDLALAPLAGLIRSAHSEHPGRFALIDTDASEASERALEWAIAASATEPQLALREGELSVPRLVKAGEGATRPSRPIDPESTVLITGGLSGIGALVARHLAAVHGARNLLLVSRRGIETEGAPELLTELEELGARVTVASCDVSDRPQLEELIGSIDPEYPLGALVHSAGVLDDGVIESLAPEQLDRVFAPKADAAWHLHELTEDLELSQFLLCSSTAGLLGGAAQANYAAANAFLDALAQHRQAKGLPATSLAWGLWQKGSGAMVKEVADADRARVMEQIRSRLGFAPISSERGLELFDAARAQGAALSAPVRFDRAVLRAQAAEGTMPALLGELLRVPARRSAGRGSLAARLAALPAPEREDFLLELVRGAAAAVLGHGSPAQVEPGRAFKELGFDSLAAVELRNRLSAQSGIRLPATVVFDYPSARELAGFLLGEVEGGGAPGQAVVRAQASDEPIAIVGMSCRFPGGVGSPRQLWQLLSEGRDAIEPFPADRGWDLERLYDPDPESTATAYAREGGFLESAAEFDPGFFGISPREALGTDPQQRLLLESSWEALEDAGIDPETLHGSPTGVFAGVMYQDYGAVETGLAAGMSASVVSGRVAYAFGLEGPAMTVDTACSSSLVTLHLASQALRSGECGLALAGGVTVLSTPGMLTFFSQQRGLSPDGRCKAFAEAADGVGFAEGVGVLALERLSEAEAKGHRVLAVIRGSAVNQDGASNGLTAPNGPSQERVIRQALANARLEPKDVDAVEAHGTGTTLGDPIEAGALLATYGQERDEPLKLGSIKSNIGHTQAAAGVAGVIKTVLAMREGILPKTLHVDQPSSKVDWEAGEIELLTEPAEWKPNGHPRRAGVSSFGASGTNAHLILEEAPGPREPDEPEEASGLPGPLPFALSAKSPEALRASAQRLAAHLQDNPELNLTDLSFSLATTRAQLEQRAVTVAADREELLASLAALAKGEPSPDTRTATAQAGRLACLFTGQGSQRAGMGKELYATYPAYAEALDQACEAIDPHLGQPLKELVFSEPGSKKAALLDHTTCAQPALFATELALYRLLESFGLKAELLTGHSVGEITAAHIAGVFSLEDAAKLISARGTLMGALPEGGAMLAIEATEQEATESIEGREDLLSLAAINSPTATVISGDAEAIDQAEAHWQEQGRKTKRLQVSHAFHSPLIEPMLDQFSEVVSTLTLNEPTLPVISNTTGEPLTPEEATDPAYWTAHARQPVRFADAVTTLQDQGATTYLELGPDAVLSAMAAASLEGKDASLIATLREGRDEPQSLTLALASAHAAGASPDWQAYFEGSGAKAVSLPTYPFQRKRYWIAAGSAGSDPAAMGLTDAGHPLLGAVIEDPQGEGLILTGRISLQSHPWLADHAIAGSVLLPGAALVEMALAAGQQAGCELLTELTLQSPLALPESGAVQLQVRVEGPGEDGEREVSIHSRAEEVEAQWSCHAEGTVAAEAPEASESLQSWPPPGAEPIDVDSAYQRLAEAGFEYGPAFQGLTAAWRDGEEVYAEVSLAPEQEADAGRFGVHPALLDGALHGVLLDSLAGGGSSAPMLPFAWSGVALHGAGATRLRVRIAARGGEEVSLDLADESGNLFGRIASLRVREIDPEQLRASAPARDGLLHLSWEKIPVELDPRSDSTTELLHAEELGLERSGDPAADARAATTAALAAVQEWLAGKGAEPGRLVLLTAGALATAEAEDPDLPLTPLAGLIRSAASEHPGRFALIDTDGSEASEQALPAAIAASATEPQLALREGEALVPRVARRAGPATRGAWPLLAYPEATVLITGGTGGLGALLARHLVAEHGARRLLLVSRRGPEAEGAPELLAELQELGASVRVEACDVSGRSQLEELIGSIDSEHPLGAVVHAAGVLDDGLIESMDAASVERVFAPKLDAAWHLHELTRDLDLSSFVLFSSVAGILGSPAQANYAAANAFLDALAVHRRAEGLPATSMAWGLWAQEAGMGSRLGEAGLARMKRAGLAPLSDGQGLALFDAALGSEDANLLPVRFAFAALRRQGAQGALPAPLRGLVRGRRDERERGSLAGRLEGLAEADRQGFVLDLVRTHTATVLGHASAAQVEPERAFQELGFDSLAAVELRNRLSSATGLTLPATVVFDYPNATALAGYLLGEVGGKTARPTPARAQASEEPIAIVGMSCRYPGGAGAPRQLWQLMAEGRDAVGEFPNDRGWDLEQLYDPDPEGDGTSYTRQGGFLTDAGDFDAGFFGISPLDALGTDPQQRLLLEASWEALEDAGVDPQRLRGSDAGVFAGVMYHDYGWGQGPASEGYGLTVGSGSVLSGRVAYTLGLEGPAITVDTACSSSLVAMHLAAQALRSGECSMALAGGVTVLATPRGFIEFSRQRGLSPDGRCKSFADSADGVGWSEGVGVLALERLSGAEANGHNVLAVIRGSAVNQDGASNGLTAPNGPSQERVIRQALANARLEPKDVDAVEAHGTGTTLGDPIEAGALLATYGQERDEPLKLGSIKSNIGHTQAAAGVAGVIKTVLAMREGVLPKTLHVDQPSSKVDWEAGEIELLTEPAEWKPNGHPRRAGVSSFGASGTNAHLILEEAPGAKEADEPIETRDLPGPLPFALSAKSPEALRASAQRLASHIQDNPDLGFTDLSFSLATTRAQLEQRAVTVATEREELLAALSALAKGEPSPDTHTATAQAGRLAYLFTGQGSQRPGMGRELYETHAAHAKALDQACEAIDPHLDRLLKELIFSEPGSEEAELLDHTTYAQPALFATELALYRLLESFGLKAELLTGHSVGEITAAHIAGVFSLEDAAKLISARGTLMGALPEGGAMLAIEATEQEATESIEGREDLLSLAAINSPTATVISGDAEAIDQAEAHWQEQGRKTKRLQVSHAFHSPLIEPMLDQFSEVVSTLTLNEPTLPVISNTTGEPLTPEEATDPAYWTAHARQPVRFADAVTTLQDQGATTYLELGPDAVLSAMAAASLEGKDASLIATLREGRDEPQSLTLALASAHAAGASPDWQAYFEGSGAKAVSLPTYPFQRKRYWIEAGSAGSDPAAMGLADAGHPFLSALIEDPGGEGLALAGRISLQSHPWLADHAIADTVLLPGAALVEMALAAGQQAGCELLTELTLQSPLALPESGAVQLQVRVEGPGEDGEREVSIHSRAEEVEAQWSCHAEGTVAAEAPEASESLQSWPPPGAEPIDVDSAYQRLAEAGFEYGPAFQGLTAAWRDGEEVYAEVSLAPEQEADAGRFGVHPALLDSAFHAGLGSLTDDRGGAGGKLMLPFAWNGVRVLSPGAGALRVRLEMGEDSIGITAFDGDGAQVLGVDSVAGRELDPASLRNVSAKRALYLWEWRDAPAVEGESSGEPEPVELLELAELGFERSGDLAASARAATASALQYVQGWLADEERAGERLVMLTTNAVAAGRGEDPDLPGAAVWGLLRSAQAEHPGRFALIDTDSSEASGQALPAAIAASATEPQLALREGKALVPRFVPAEPTGNGAATFDPEATVLVSGGLSGIGALVARHLVEAHGARQLLLFSRRGIETPGSTGLLAELRGLGAEVEVAACDASDRTQLEDLIGSIDPEHPLGAIVHSAGVLDDGLIESLDQERLERVMRPKADAAWNLHELTSDLDLSAFVLFSSAAGLLGGAAQANYAAANAFLDALARHRRERGLPAASIAWGLWEQASEAMVGNFAESDRERVIGQIRARLGFAPMPADEGLRLFDAALALDVSLAAPVCFDRAVLRAQAASGALPATLRDLVASPARRQARGSLAGRLAGVPEPERHRIALELVRGLAADVLGHSSAAAVEPGRAFKELGFDSLAAVELRNRLGAATGLRLPATIAFDYPSAAELAAHLLAELSGAGGRPQAVRRARASEEPIAIVGMSCRFPGGVGSPEQLWDLIREGRDAVGEFPDDRGWDLERLYSPDPDDVGTTYAREGGFMDDAAEFDPAFFGISPRDALGTDPQQRLLLEASWEALEGAGIDPLALRGSPTGVYAGVMYQDYGAIEAGLAAGMSASVVSGRVAYAFGLEGPTMTIDTACSSSLVALHLAAGALRSGECGLALAGGVTVLSTPWMLATFARQRGLAPDGRCKSFAEAADGVGFAEGVGVLALERLSGAEAKGHNVLAVIRGSAVNQDGASNGLTAPNGPSQERVIRQALANARLEPKDIEVVEAHGTGTTLGDPIEAGALLATYGQERDEPLKLGSVKSNIGHTQAAAGVAGVIKAVLAMREGVLPKTLHVDRPSSKVDWEAGEIELLTEPAEWKPNGHPRRAGVSSFGASGTNAHLILEEAPALSAGAPGQGAEGPGASSGREIPGPLPFALSAKSPEALRDSAQRLVSHLQDNPELGLADLSFSLATTRAQLEQRAVTVATEREELLVSLEALAKGEPSPDTATATAQAGRLAYLFTGQGSQRVGMGKELHETYPAYAKALDQACEAIDPHLDQPLRELIFSEPGSKEAALLDHTTYAQPALFATELALYRLLFSFGLKAELLTGHSVGEIVAAHIAGVFSLEDAAKLISARGALMGALPEGGAMLAIEATEQEATDSIEGKEELLSLAAINAPTATVISGDAEAVEELEAHWQDRDRKTKRLAVSHAFHSPLIEPMLEEFSGVVSSLSLSEPTLPVISNTTGETLTPEQATDPAYWVAHARQPVRFADAVTTLQDQGASTYLELGPDAVLSAMAAASLEGEESAALVATLREGRPEPHSLALALAQAHAAGASPDWQAYFKGSGAKAVPLPTYPFQRKRYWIEAGSSGSDPAAMGLADAGHPFLSALIEDPSGEGLTLSGRISLQSHPWLADHVIFGTPILPGTAFLELVLRAGAEVGCETLAELTLQAPLPLPESGAVQLQVRVEGPNEDGERVVSIHSRHEGEEAGEWSCHARGVLSPKAQSPPAPLDQWPPPGAEPVDAGSAYQHLAGAGFDYGPAFQGLTAAWRDGEEVYAEVSLAEEQHSEAGRFGVHPALFDAAFHAGLGSLIGEGAKLMLPFAWSGVQIASPGAGVLRVRLEMGEGAIGIAAFDDGGNQVLRVDSVAGRELDPGLIPAARSSEGLLELEWVEAVAEPNVEESPVKLLRADELPFKRSGNPAADARAATTAALAAVQERLAGEGPDSERLVLLTTNALVTAEGEGPDLALAPLAGLFRSAHSEHPGRFVLIDTDGSEASERALPAAIAASATEPQLALREGELLVPRVARAAKADPKREEPRPIDPDRTVLVTGGLSGIGALVARHLVEAHGARNLLLVSRRGAEAEGAAELGAELEELGAEATVAACDAADRPQLEDLIGSINPEHPLGAIVHSAGVLDDGLIESLDQERLERVMRPKADAAWNLHELTSDLDLSAFVLFSSVAGTLGGPGQANYAAANAFLDALAAHRRADGLPATSVAWGPWETGMAARLADADRARMERSGVSALADAQGLSLLDAALDAPHALVLAVRLNSGALRVQASQGALPTLFSGLVRVPARRRREHGSLAERLALVPAGERAGLALELVRAQTATVLGHDSATQVEPGTAFKELGFDSLAAVELRNRLGAATGMQLPATLVFDYPNAAALAGYLLSLASGEEGEAVLESREREIREALASIPLGRLRGAGLLDSLLRLSGEAEQADMGLEENADAIDAMDVEELIRESAVDSADVAAVDRGERQAG